MYNISLLCYISVPIFIIISIVTVAVGIVGGFFLRGIISKKQLQKATIDSAKIIEDAYAQAKNISKDATNAAKLEFNELKITYETELKERKKEVQSMQDRAIQREKNLEKKEDILDKKVENLEIQKENLKEKEDLLTSKNDKLDQELKNVIVKLEEVSGMSKQQAKDVLIDKITEEAKEDAAKIAKNIEDNAKQDANKKAKNIITLAIQKCAADHSSESTISVVPLPNEELKGRIIGREGRNIKALENATGVDLIIDDTPETITLSGFDPIRREIARIALEKLILDGRIHPGRIEELVGKVKRDVENTIKEAGENACFDADIHNLHPEIVKTLGRLKYRTSYGQNVLKHSLEVSFLAGMMAAEIGANEKVARRGGLLHDIGKAVDHEVEGTHISIGVDLATKYKESSEVIHCIAAHHNDIEPLTLEAVLVQAADAISSARPGARRESLENYIKRLESLENIANSFTGIEKSYAIQAGREIRVLVKPNEVNDVQALVLAKDIAKRIENEMEYPGVIRVNVIRELRSIEVAK